MFKISLVALSVIVLVLPVAAIPDLLTWITLDLFVGHYLHLAVPLWVTVPLLVAVGILPARWLGRLALEVYRVERELAQGPDAGQP